jgi:hypothetical protein
MHLPGHLRGMPILDPVLFAEIIHHLVWAISLPLLGAGRASQSRMLKGLQ